MNLVAFLATLSDLFERAGTPYMVCGSVASTFYSASRSTRDVDVVMTLDGAALNNLIAQLPKDQYYVDRDTARSAILRRSMFNIIDIASGWKVDVIVRKNRAFSREEFKRRVLVDYHGVALYIATVEDCILSKLEWAFKSGSERQLADVQSLLAVSQGALDHEYLARWVPALGVNALWNQVQHAAPL